MEKNWLTDLLIKIIATSIKRECGKQKRGEHKYRRRRKTPPYRSAFLSILSPKCPCDCSVVMLVVGLATCPHVAPIWSSG